MPIGALVLQLALHLREQAIPRPASAKDCRRNRLQQSPENGLASGSNDQSTVLAEAWTRTLLDPELTPGTHARELPQNVRSTGESRYCQSIARAQWTHRPHICESQSRATETALHWLDYWEGGSLNSRAALLHIVVTFAKPPPFDSRVSSAT